MPDSIVRFDNVRSVTATENYLSLAIHFMASDFQPVTINVSDINRTYSASFF